MRKGHFDWEDKKNAGRGTYKRNDVRNGKGAFRLGRKKKNREGSLTRAKERKSGEGAITNDSLL